MNTAATAPLVNDHTVTVSLKYGEEDVERAANSLNISLSGEETEAILAAIDAELSSLASAAVRSAVASRIYDDLTRVARGHACSDDD